MSSFWDRAAGLYDLAEWTNRRVNAAARKRVGELVPAGAKVLDCAPGTGQANGRGHRGKVPEAIGVLEKPAK